MTLRIHPSFDLRTSTWFIDGIAEAPTIAALVEKLRSRFGNIEVEGYYPAGTRYELPTELRRNLNNEQRIADRAAHELARASVRREKPRARITAAGAGVGAKRQFDRERIIQLWAAGKLTREIAAEVGCMPVTIDAALREARANNDPRAARRGRGAQFVSLMSRLEEKTA